VASTLASFDLLLLCAITLSIALIDTPVPRVWALPAVALLTVQTWALYMMEPADPSAPPPDALVETGWEAVAALAVPALTAALLTVIFFHCARAYAQAKRRLEAALQAQAIGKDIPTGCGAAGGSGSCMTGSSTGDSATSPRAA
jgi:hypothetical protein